MDELNDTVGGSSPERGTSTPESEESTTLPAVHRRRTGVASAELDGATTLFDGTSTALVLNSTASAIWEELVEPVTLAQLVDRLSARFRAPVEPVGAEEMTSQVAAVLTELGRRGLVLSSTPSGAD